ncbi:globin [filamentous cyanobacterium LEGE 11480]|uniref:Globin n=1 Tax=Romeriopsis navalis LEGE 11480 TaxID=2777977 RepID=A0A928Z6D0_9CYAN|nr:globin family protein [Romeriopsis navalis]MBE9032493.1 globin [Romeriopsis navalis LEGE 11480]
MSLQVELLEQSFEKVKPQAEAFAASFYDTLFTDAPAAKPLFAHVSIEEQAGKLLKSLVFVVNNLRNSEALVGALEGLGARHVKYGALPEHYPLVGAALLKTFESYLGADWTPDVKQAWVDAYGVITEVMLKGADYSEAEVALPEEEAPGLPVELLEQSFEKIKPQASEFAASFYDTLFTDSPAAKPLFAHVSLEQQASKLVKSLVFVVENLRNSEALVGALEGLGARHVKYGALPEHYPLVGSALLKTFESYLGADWTPDVKQAWVDAYGVITEVMLKGADYSAAEVALPAESPISKEIAPKGILGVFANLFGGK